MRGIAVLAVLAYHAHLPWMRGGYLGVDVFFVLSGYLITVQLLKMPQMRGVGALARFYGLFLAHRATRLLPALLTMLAATVALGAWLPVDRQNAGACTARAATYTMNLPDAERLHCPAIWHVSWSLAAEVQFYAIWPVALLGLIWLVRRAAAPATRLAAVVVTGLFVAAVCWHLAVWNKPGGKQHFLFAPDGRSLILLLGCAIALLTARPMFEGARLRGPVARVVAVVALGAALVLGHSTSAASAIGYYLVVAIATTLLLVQALGQGSGAPAMLRWRATTWLGRISYSLYLWHEIAYAASRKMALPDPRLTIAVGVALALVTATASYRWVEVPAQRALRRALPRLGARSTAGPAYTAPIGAPEMQPAAA
jgi:peptidoglycan/LPS O-acetylase OafA/YrhL